METGMTPHGDRNLFWSHKVPPSEGSLEWVKTILEEGRSEDILPLLSHPNAASGVWLARRVRSIWNQYIEMEADKTMNADKVITPEHRRILQIASEHLAPHNYRLVGGTALAACYLFHRESEDIDLFTTQEDIPAGVKESFISACERNGLIVKTERTAAHFTRLWIGNPPIKVELAYNGGFSIEPAAMRIENMPVASLPDLAADKLLALRDRAAARDFVDVFFLAQEHYDITQMEALAGRKDHGFLEADRYYWAQALAQIDRVALQNVRMLRHLDLREIQTFFHQATNRVMNSIKLAGQRPLVNASGAQHQTHNQKVSKGGKVDLRAWTHGYAQVAKPGKTHLLDPSKPNTCICGWAFGHAANVRIIYLFDLPAKVDFCDKCKESAR